MRFTPNFSTVVGRVINSKVVDLLILYNFYKGRMAFFSTIFAKFSCQVGRFLGASEQCRGALTKLFHAFPLQISNAIQHESCVL
jgi:hypothetical protein